MVYCGTLLTYLFVCALIYIVISNYDCMLSTYGYRLILDFTYLFFFQLTALKPRFYCRVNIFMLLLKAGFARKIHTSV
jgi:hypothetical protein